MPGIERRRHRRVDCDLPVRLYVQGRARPVEASVKNISTSGAFVQATEKFPEGEKVLLEFKDASLAMIHGQVSAEAASDTVGRPPMPSSASAYIKRIQGSGIGVEFLNIRPDVERFLSELMDLLEAQKIKP